MDTYGWDDRFDYADTEPDGPRMRLADGQSTNVLGPVADDPWMDHSGPTTTADGGPIF